MGAKPEDLVAQTESRLAASTAVLVSRTAEAVLGAAVASGADILLVTTASTTGADNASRLDASGGRCGSGGSGTVGGGSGRELGGRRSSEAGGAIPVGAGVTEAFSNSDA